MATTTHLPSSSFSPTLQFNTTTVWNYVAWNTSQTIVTRLSKSTDKTPETSTSTATLIYAAITILTIVFVLGSIGNFLVIWILGFKMKRTVVTLFFLHLSIADFILVLQIPVVIAPIAMDSHWAMGTAACKLHTYAFVVNMNASVYFLTLISLDRYAALLHPVSSLPLRRLHLARWLCLAVWLLAMLLSLPPLIFRTTRWTNEGFVACYNSYGEDFDVQARWGTAMKISRFVLSFAVPYAVMIFCYCRIGARLRRVDKTRRGNSLRIIVVVVVAFSVCWAPYHAIGLMEAASYVQDDESLLTAAEWADPVIWGFAFINSCINPILYVFSGSDLKARFRRSLVAAIENAFRDHEPLDSGQDSRSGHTAQSRDLVDIAMVSTDVISTNISSDSNGNAEGGRVDGTRVALVQEERV
ncbi:chemerin-like receptor 2 [Lethenteron reissneri]|uniref:chemerin-like receptor 2 n=1 Tax=Lethenteron reissneri TaxID=7753 RepID=UPI002AB6AE7F|nr:chemerin-like receptor 2 [Lethenteron reissneri]